MAQSHFRRHWIGALRPGRMAVEKLRRRFWRTLPFATSWVRDTPSHVVLIIEDDEDTRVCYHEFLEILGFHVTSVAGGAEALEALRRCHIDAVLLDLSLPDTDGRVLNQQLRSIAAPRELPVMAITGHDLGHSERVKFTAAMRKPVDLDAVAAWLREVAPTDAASGQPG